MFGLFGKKKPKKVEPTIDEVFEEPVKDIHTFFGLSYSNYLVVPRSVIQSANLSTQRKIVEALEEMEEQLGNWEDGDYYNVTRIDGETKKFKSDDLADYQRGRRKVCFKNCKECKKFCS